MLNINWWYKIIIIFFLLMFYVLSAQKSRGFFVNYAQAQGFVFEVSEPILPVINLEEWQAEGVVSFGNEIEAEIVQIGDLTANNLWQENFIWQTLANDKKIKSLSFDYLLESEEDLPLFDELGFVVLINDEVVYRLGASDKSLEWRSVFLNLQDYVDLDELSIKFAAGNSGDNLKNTWVKVKNIKLNVWSDDEISPDNISDLIVTSQVENEFWFKFSAPQEDGVLQKYYFYGVSAEVSLEQDLDSLISVSTLLEEISSDWSGLILSPHNFEGQELHLVRKESDQDIKYFYVISEDSKGNKSISNFSQVDL